jgi:hypothetical protein
MIAQPLSLHFLFVTFVTIGSTAFMSLIPITNHHLTSHILSTNIQHRHQQQPQQIHLRISQLYHYHHHSTTQSSNDRRRTYRYTSPLSSSKSSTGSNNYNERRKVLLSRTGPYFKLDRRTGTIEFGATANLVTQLQKQPLYQEIATPSSEDDDHDTTTTTTTTTTNDKNLRNMIDTWLLDENRGLAMSIWDPKLMKDLGNNIYRLQIMTLQFVTITLAPWVNVKMETITTHINNNSDNNDNNINSKPTFIVQSIDFDPNIQILPGMRINADSLGIVIEVAGILRSGNDGTSVTGVMTFQTSGTLPPPLRLLPDIVLKTASDTINTTIVNFVIQSFQNGAKTNYQQFLRQYKERKQKESELSSKS